jgi:spore maturation protein SpmB
MMNFSANMLGLDNAATPLGLAAMKELQELNPEKERATDAQIMFLALNTAGLTIIPTSVIGLRLTAGAANAADIFVPTLIVTFFSFFSAMLAVAAFQRINLFKWPVLLFTGGFIGLMLLLFRWMQGKPPEYIATYTGLLGALIIFVIIIAFIVAGLVKRQQVYENFIDGAKEGFSTSVTIIPYLVAMLVAISVFRTTGCLDYLINGISSLVQGLGINADFVPALPVGLMKTLSGGAARGLMVDIFKNPLYGPDSFQGKLASIMQGGTETTFYVLAVYFGSVGIKKTRHAVACGLIADLVGIIAAIVVAYLFFK